MISYEEGLKAMKEAKTAREMVESWSKRLEPGIGRELKRETSLKAFGFYADRAPHFIETLIQKPLVDVYERRWLDAKTRELVLVGILAARSSPAGIIGHIQEAIENGATEEEVLEVMFLVAYELAKGNVGMTCQLVEEAFRQVAQSKANQELT